jgi:nucleoid-associated protein YgaU
LLAALTCIATPVAVMAFTSVGGVVGPERDLVLATAWAARVVAVYLSAALSIALLELAPGRMGRLVGPLHNAVPPLARAAARLLTGAAAASCLATGTVRTLPLATGTVRTVPAPVGDSLAAAVQPVPLPPLDWPGLSAPIRLPALLAPPTTALPSRPSRSPRPALTARPALPAPPARPAAGPPWLPAENPTAAASVVVRPGDSLWSIARRALGPRASDAQVALAWPRWWAANRNAVGSDPNLIHPGLRLLAPTAPSVRRTT